MKNMTKLTRHNLIIYYQQRVEDLGSREPCQSSTLFWL